MNFSCSKFSVFSVLSVVLVIVFQSANFLGLEMKNHSDLIAH